MTCCDEYCANYGCNQGRNCPVRVAKYKPVMRAADPLPPSIWRQQLRYLAEWVLLSIAGVVWVAFLLLLFWSVTK
jgi:hypothetical protein